MRNLIWLSPEAPSGAPAIGAGTPVQVLPASSVRATDVQNWEAQWPGVRAWPITQPVLVPTKVTEVGRKLPGTGPGSAGPAEFVSGEALPDAFRPADWAELAELLWAPATGAAVGFGFSTGRLTTWGTVTAAATITAADPAVMASLRYLRRRALRLIRSNVPGGGGSGSIRSLSQASTSS